MPDCSFMNARKTHTAATSPGVHVIGMDVDQNAPAVFHDPRRLLFPGRDIGMPEDIEERVILGRVIGNSIRFPM